MCILDTEHSNPSSDGVLFVLDFLDVVANVHSSRMISVVEHQATVESGLKMRIKRKNLSPSLTSVVKVISSNDLLFESLENGHIRDEESVLPKQSIDSLSDSNLAITKRSKKCRKNLRSHGSSKNRKKVRHFVPQIEGVIGGDNVTESCCRLLKDFSDTQECSNMGESTETEDERPLESSNGTSLPSQSQDLNAFPEKQGLKEIIDSEGAESEDKEINRKSTSFVKPRLEDALTDGCQRRDASTEMCDAGVITDPDCLGPCEPGTSVILEGIVWNESNNGILVVNVTWRGKTYVGTLMDTTKHDWAPPRFREDSPNDESSMNSRRGCSSAGTAEVIEGRRLRKCRRDAAAAATASSATKPWCVRLNTDATESIPRQQLFPLRSEDGPERSQCSSSILKRSCRVTDGSETLLECSEPNCEKKYRRISGLRYHQSHAHRGRPSSTAGEIDAFSSCVAEKRSELGINSFVELSKSLSPEADAGKESEGLASTLEKPDLDISDFGNEKTTLLGRKRKAVAASFYTKLRTIEENVGGHLPSYSRSSEEYLVDSSTHSVELNRKSTVESNENCSNVATGDVTTDLSENASGQFSFLDKKMSCLSFNSNPNSPEKNSGSPLRNQLKDYLLDESLPMLFTCPSNGALTSRETTISLNNVSYDFARQKLSVIDWQQKYGTKTPTTFADQPKSHLKDIILLSDQSTDDKLIHMEVKSDPLIGCSVSGKSCNGNFNVNTCCYKVKPKKGTQVCNPKSLQNTSANENHSTHESTRDSKHLRVCNELCAIAAFDCSVFEKPSRVSCLSEEIPGAVGDVFQHPISGFDRCDQRAEKLVGKHVISASTVARNPLCGDDVHRVVREKHCSLISPRNGIRKKQGFDEDRNNRRFTSASQPSSGPPQLLPDLIEAFDDLPDPINAPKRPSADSTLSSGGPCKEPRTADEVEDKECSRRIESVAVSLTDIRSQTLDRKISYSIQHSSENTAQVCGEESVLASEKGASTLNMLNPPVNNFVKHSNSRQPLGLDDSQTNSPAMLPSQIPSKKAASDEQLSLDEHFDNSKKHTLSILHRCKKSTAGKDHSTVEQSKRGWADEPHSRLSVPPSNTKSIDAQDPKPFNETGKSDPELCHKRPQHLSSTPAEQQTVASKEDPSGESNLHSSKAIQEQSSFSADGRQKTETKSINECRTRSWKGDAHRVQNDLDLSQVKGVTAQNSSRRSQLRSRLSPSGDRHLHSHAVTKSPFNPVYGQYAASLLSPSSLVPAVVVPDLCGPNSSV